MIRIPACAALVLLAALASAQEPRPVRVDAVRRESVREMRRVTGAVRAERRSLVATQEPGPVVELAVREGQTVAAGDLLARLDATRLRIEHERMSAELMVSTALLSERESEEQKARRDRAAVAELAARGAAKQRELEDADTALAIATARKDQTRWSLSVLSLELALLDRRLADTEIRAPFAGIVAKKHTELGQWLVLGAPVVELIGAERLEAWLDVPERQLAAVLEQHGPLRLVVEASGLELALDLYRAIPDVDARARTFALVAPLPATHGLAAGMSVVAWAPTGAQVEHLTVALDALLRNDAGPYLWVAQPGEPGAPALAVPVPVEVVFTDNGRAAVRGRGLAEGALAIVEGNERLFPMAPVRPLAKADAR